MGGTGLRPKSVGPRPVVAAQRDWIFHHGTPDERTWEHGSAYGIHVGTEQAAHDALNARIGKPLEGRWDGTREYGKTLLDPRQSTGSERGGEARYPTGRATYSTGHPVPMDARPSVFPVRITGPMIGHPAAPVEDDYANSRMHGQITRGNARRGYFYRNVGEDEGSISAAVPSAAHLERVHPPREAAAPGHHVLYHGAHHDDVGSILSSGLRGEPGQPIVTDSREGAELYAHKRDWTDPKVLEIHVPHDQADRYLDEPERGTSIEGNVRSLRATLPPEFIRAVHDAGSARTAARQEAADGPWYHGTRSQFSPGEMLSPQGKAARNNDDPRSGHHVYYTRNFPMAAWAADNAKGNGQGRVYEVRPTGPHEDDPTLISESGNNPTRSYRTRHPVEVVREVSQDDFEYDPAAKRVVRKTSSWSPQVGIFAPTTGLDPRLFEGDSLRPGVRHAVMEKLDRCLRVDSGLAGSDWQEWLHVWIAGGSASEWAGGRPNDAAQDLDVITGLDLATAQGYNSFEGMDQAQAATALNAAFRHCFNETGWHAPFGGVWDLTAYCNPHVTSDITVIRPYAAWDLTDGRWSVQPPHLPQHTLADFDPAVVAHGRAVLAEARAILRMPEPLRTREARALWAHLHEHRCQAFSAEGTGWDDPGNVDEKMLAYAPRGVLEKIKDLAMAGTITVTGAAGGYLRNPYHGNPEIGGREDWSHTWFHGTTGHEAPAFGEAKPGSEAEKRPGSSWEQPNKYLGVHVTPLRSVAQKFAHGVYASRIGEGSPGVPSAIVHMRLRMSSPKHFPTERGMDLDIARYASEHHPGWHDDKLNGSLGWNYSDQEGTHRDWHAPAEGADAERLGRQAQQVLQHHPRLPEIMRGYVSHLHRSGFDGITYGNEVEGPGDWHRGAQSISAIATHPSQIETTRVEHIAPPNFGRPGDPPPEPHQITHAASEAASEPEDMLGRVAAFHAAHGGKLPCKIAAAEREEAAPEEQDYWIGHRAPGPGHTGPDGRPRASVSYHEAAGRDPDELVDVYRAAPEHADTINRGDWVTLHGDWARERAENSFEHRTLHARVPARHVWLDADERDDDEAGYHGPPIGGISAVAAREEAAENPPCCYCDEPLYDEDVRDGHSAHEECQDMRWCHACEEHHDDPQEADNHNETYTEWGNHLPFEGGMHRGITVRLPEHVHAVVHDEARPAAERAAALAAHLRDNPVDYSDEGGHAGGYGVHWTDHEPTARAWGTGEGALFGPSEDERSGRDHTHVVMHAASPDEEHIETDPRVLDEGNLLGFDHARSEREIPLRSEAPVRLTGLSWKRADHGEWNRHDFDGSPGRLAVREAAWEDEDTDRYVTCDQGHQHWGSAGAAGLLIRHRGDDGQHRYLLQHRSPYVQHGGTWSTPGGALAHGESPEQGARREAEEEFGSLPSGLTHHHTFTDDHGGWAYHTVVMDSPHQFSPHGGGEGDWETQGHGWFTPAEMKGLQLHPGFAASWEKVRKSGAVQKTAEVPPREVREYEGRTGDPSHITRSELGLIPTSAVAGMRGARGEVPGFGHAEQQGLVEDRMRRQASRQLSGWQGWTAERPHQAVVNRAQETFRERHPGLTEPLDDRDWDMWGSDSQPSPRGEEMARKILRDAGHPQWDQVAVLPHDRHSAMTGVTPDGRPAIMLTRGQWHAGSLAHEAAHIAHLHALGVDHAEHARSATGDEISLGLTDEQIHGPEFARHYAGALESLVPGGREEFLGDHANAVSLVGNQRHRVHGLPREFGGGIRREGAAEPAWHGLADREPNHAVFSAVQDQVRRAHPGLSAPVADPTGTMRKMLGRASFIMPKEEIEAAQAPPGQHDTLSLAHHAAHVITDSRQAQEDAVRRMPGERRPLSAEMDPDDRSHGHGFAWHYALALDGAGHDQAADDLRGGYADAQVQVADHRHARGLARDFPGSGLSPHMPPDQGHLPEMPESQRKAMAPGAHRDALLGVAKNPEPGTRIWRGERREAAEDASDASSVGLHWSVHPANTITSPYNDDQGSRPVLWQARLEHPAGQMIPRSHPMWQGRHMSMDAEAEVRLHPGSSVHVEGAWVGQPGNSNPAPAYPLTPGRNGPGWEWHPVDRHIPVSHRPGWGHSIDYSDVGIPKEAASGFAWYHGTASEFQPGDLVDPAQAGKVQRTARPGSAYFTHSLGQATDFADWAQKASRSADGEHPTAHVYEVEPTGDYEEDPDDSRNAWVSRSPLRVVRHVMSKELGDHWPKTAATGYEGVEFSHHHEDFGDQEVHMMAATHPDALPSDDPWGGGTGVPNHIGHISWTNWHDGEAPEVDNLVVANRFRHQGIATELWRRAREIEPSLKHSGEMTNAGRGWARTVTGVTGYENLTKRSGMIYLDLPEGTVRHLPGGVDDHHITLVYLGKNVSDDAFEEAVRRTREAAEAHAPMEGSIGGLGSFEPSDSSDGKRPVFVPVDVPGLGKLRGSLADLSASEFKDYKAHVTLAYLDEDEPMPAPHPQIPVSFPRLHVKRGDEIESFPFTGGQLSKAAAVPPAEHWNGEELAEHLRGPHGWIVHPEHDLEHEHAWDHQTGEVEEPHEHAPGQASHPLAGVEPPTHTEVLRSLRSGPREMPVHKALRLRSGDWGGRVIDHLGDIEQKIRDDYEDGGEGLRRAMSKGALPGGPLVVNSGQLDDGHRRLWVAHNLGWSSVQVRSGDWTPGGDRAHTAIRSGAGDLYLRFGAWPHDERSFSPAGGYHEEGVSAYDLDDHGNPKDPDPRGERGHVHDESCEDDCPLDYDEEYGNDTGDEMRGRVQRAERHRYYGEDDPRDTGHLVRGDMIGVGYDGEPLLKNVRRVGDWIDHRHQFIYSAAPHRLARDEADDDYEPPEEKPGAHRP